MGILNNNTEWGNQGDKSPSYSWNSSQNTYKRAVDIANFKDYGLKVGPDVRMPYARKDVVITLKYIQDGINKDFSSKGYGFKIVGGSRPYNPPNYVRGHNNLVGVDIVPTGGMKWDQLVDAVKKYGKGFDGNIHKNIKPGTRFKSDADYGKILPNRANELSTSEQANYHLDLKYTKPYNPNITGAIINSQSKPTSKGPSTNQTPKTASDFYNPNTQKVNYGTSPKGSNYGNNQASGGVFKQLPVAAKPYNRNEPPSTPNNTENC